MRRPTSRGCWWDSGRGPSSSTPRTPQGDRTGPRPPDSQPQLSDEQLAEAGVQPDLIRLSVGIENVADIIDDIQQALEVTFAS